MSKSSADVLLMIPAAPDALGRREERIGIGYLAAVLRDAGHRVRVHDSQAILGQAGYTRVDARDAAGWNPERWLPPKHDFHKLSAPLLERDWDVIGFSVLSCEIESCAQLVRHLRERGSRAHVTLGGETPTLELAWIFDEVPGIDSVVLGEGEYALLELADAVLHQRNWHKVPGLAWREGGQIRRSPPRQRLNDLDALPFPDRQTLPALKQWQPMANITATRDCFYRCTYCSVRRFWGTKAGGWRRRNPALVADEIAEVQRDFGVNDFTFTDPIFMGAGRAGRDAAAALAEELIRRDLGVSFRLKVRADTLNRALVELLAKAGLWRVGIGVESAWQPTLDLWKKGEAVEENIAAVEMINEAGLDVDMGFIMFHPLSSIDESEANLGFLRHWLDVARRPGLTDLYAAYTKLIPYRGTEVHEQLQEQGLLDAEGNYGCQDPLVAEVFDFLWSQVRPRLRTCIRPLIAWEMAAKKLRMETGDQAREREFGEVVRGLGIHVLELCGRACRNVRSGRIEDGGLHDRIKSFEVDVQAAKEQSIERITQLGV